MAKWYAATGTTGADNSLDMVPDPGDYTDLSTGDMCFCFHNGLYTRIYEYDEALVASESIFGTEVIPDGNVSGTGAWKEKRTTGLMTFWAGTVANHIEAVITEAGGVVSLDFECTGSIPGVGIWSDDIVPIPIQSITLNHGSDVAPTANYVFVLKADQETLVVDTEWPTTEHVKIAYCLVPSAAYVAAEGAYIHQNWNDGNEPNGMGHLSQMGENIRLTQDGAHWHSGVAGNGATDNYITIVTEDTPDSAYFLSTAGECFQMHRHIVPAYSSLGNGGMLCVNSDAGAYTPRNDIRDEVVDAGGNSLTNKYYNIVFWMVANKGGEHAPTMMNMPTGSYNGLQSAINDVDGYDVYDIPRQFKEDSATGFLVCRITFKQTGSGITVENTTDLRGRTPGTASGTALVAGTEFADNQFKVYSVGDVTKIIDLDLTGVTTGNTRTIEIPDHDMIIPGGTLAGATELYFAGALAMGTIATGGFVQDTDGDDPFLEFKDNGGTTQGYFQFYGATEFQAVMGGTQFIHADEAGAVALNYAGTKKFETSNTGATLVGILVADGLTLGQNEVITFGTEGLLYSNATAVSILNYASTEYMAKFTQDAGVELYYNGAVSLSTTSTGFTTGDGTNTTAVGHIDSNVHFSIQNSGTGGGVSLKGMKSAGPTLVTILTGDPDGDVELYHAGVKTFATTSETNGGIIIYGAATQNIVHKFSGADHYITNTTDSGIIYIRGTNVGSAATNLLVGDPDGAVELYHAGAKTFETDTGGFIVSNGANQGLYAITGDDLVVRNLVDTGRILFYAEDTGSDQTLCAIMDPDGSVDLYYEGVLVMSTTVNGILAGNVTATTMGTSGANEWTAQQGFDEDTITSTSNAVAWNLTTDQCTLHTLTENTTISAPSNMQAGSTYTLRVVQAAGVYSLAWNAAFEWGEAGVPAAPAANGDVVIFTFYSDGTTMYGVEFNRTEA